MFIYGMPIYRARQEKMVKMENLVPLDLQGTPDFKDQVGLLENL